ncbi:hypothetical protein F4604DRAFT_710980 [Suillus subluteus]|nr:hypothetical protein F4604DRAFT_710980 [Suillus subluteus]
MYLSFGYLQTAAASGQRNHFELLIDFFTFLIFGYPCLQGLVPLLGIWGIQSWLSMSLGTSVFDFGYWGIHSWLSMSPGTGTLNVGIWGIQSGLSMFPGTSTFDFGIWGIVLAIYVPRD